LNSQLQRFAESLKEGCMSRISALSCSLGLLLTVALLGASADDVAAQDRGTDRAVAQNLGYGLEPGQAVIILVPEHLQPVGEGLRTAVEVTGSPTAPASVGNCFRGQLPLQAARFYDRGGSDVAEEIQVAVLFPDNVSIPEGVVLGAWRPGGPCGPGYQILRGHVLDTSY